MEHFGLANREQLLRVLGDDFRYVEADYIGQTVDVSSSTLLDLDPTNLYQIPQEYEHRHVTLKKQEPLKNELKDFLEAAEKGRRPLANGEDGIEALRIVEAALESIRERKVVGMDGFLAG